MNEEQRAAYLQSQIVAAQLKMQGMVTANIQVSINRRWASEPVMLPYQQKDFDAIIEEYGLHHNAVMTTLNGG